MKDEAQEKALKEFFSHFYDICLSTEAFNCTMDQFYDEIPEENHVFFQNYADF